MRAMGDLEDLLIFSIKSVLELLLRKKSPLNLETESSFSNLDHSGAIL